MKYVLCLALTLVGAMAWAQQAPRAMSTDTVPLAAEGTVKWPDRTATQMQAPFGVGSGSSAQANLIRTQTEAIKALSAKIDALEARVNKLERGAR